jgi:hypothetical protein
LFSYKGVVILEHLNDFRNQLAQTEPIHFRLGAIEIMGLSFQGFAGGPKVSDRRRR